MPSIVGMAPLFAVVVNDGLLLGTIDVAKQIRRARIRLVLLMSITTASVLRRSRRRGNSEDSVRNSTRCSDERRLST